MILRLPWKAFSQFSVQSVGRRVDDLRLDYVAWRISLWADDGVAETFRVGTVARRGPSKWGTIIQ